MQNILNIVAHHTFLKIVSPYNTAQCRKKTLLHVVWYNSTVKVRKDNENRKEKLLYTVAWIFNLL